MSFFVASTFVLAGCSRLPPTGRIVSAGAPANTDAICGTGYRWENDHCVATAGAEDAKAVGLGEKVRVIGGLRIEEVREGAGRAAKKGDTVRVHYTGTLTDGTVFDTSRDRGSPLEFELGKGMVIKGFDRGIEGMREGAVRKLTIPPELGYGDRGAPPKIPGKATLVFDVELVETL